MAEKKAQSIDDISDEFDPLADLTEQVVEEADPSRSVFKKGFERFWGTDVDEDPVEFIRLGSQLVGGVGGAISGGKLGAVGGAAVGGPTGAVVGAGVGAAIGGFAGGMAGTVAPEGVMEAAEFLGIAEEGTRHRLGLNDKELATVVEGEAILDMATGGGLIAARGLARGIGKAAVAMPGMTAMLPKHYAARNLAEAAQKFGVDMLPVQVGKRIIGRGYVAVLGKFPLLSGPLRKGIDKTNVQLKKAFQDLPENIAGVAGNDDAVASVFLDAKQLVTSTAKKFDLDYADVYRRADEAGAKVNPSETVGRLASVIDEIAKEAPTSARFNKKSKAAPLMEDVKNFLTNDIGAIFRKSRAGNITIAPQDFKQMGTILDKIDTKIASLVKKEGVGAKDAVDRLQSVRQAAQIDIYSNIEGVAGKEIGADLKALDRKFTETVDDLFSTVAAKKFGITAKGGNIKIKDIPAREQMDNLTDVLMKGDISEIDEVKRLVTPETFNKLAGYHISKQIEDAFHEGGKRLDITQVVQNLGLHNKKGTVYAKTKKLVEAAGGKYGMEDVDKLVEVAETIGQVAAPEASTFIARRGVMGGAGAIVSGLVPGVAVGTAAGNSGITKSLLAGAMFVGGGQFLSRAITDPTLARSLHKVLDKEASRLVRRGAYLQMGRIFANRMVGDGEFNVRESLDWRKEYEKVINTIDRTWYERKER